MSKEDFHKDLLSRLDPETVQKALERYNRKNSNVGLHNDNESVASGVPQSSILFQWLQHLCIGNMFAEKTETGNL